MISKALKFYILLQYKRLDRWFVDIGLPSWAGYLSIIFIIVILFKLLFSNLTNSVVIFGFATIVLLSVLGEEGRIKNLKLIFSTKEFYALRIFENILVTLPFFISLIIDEKFLYAGLVVFLALMMTLFGWRIKFPFVIPSPFSKNPFEFTIGYRKSLWIIILGYLILYKAILVANFNLGSFVLGLSFLVSLSFYQKPEHPFFVWIYCDDTVTFLRNKIKIALIQVSGLTLPLLTILCLLFPSDWKMVFAVQLIGYLFIASLVIAKYSAYPKEMNLPQGLFFILSLWVPPMLFVIIPMFYKKAIYKLKPYLI